MKLFIFLLLTISFFSCAFESRERGEKEIVSAELVYSIRARIMDDRGVVIDTSSSLRRKDTIAINKKEDLKKLEEIISRSRSYDGIWKAALKYRLIVHYKDSEEELFIYNDFYRAGEKVYRTKDNLGDFCRDLISKNSEK